MNKIKKRVLITAISTLLLSLCIVTVFAAYKFIKEITVDNQVGTIDIDSKSFYNYAMYSNDTSDDNYLDPTDNNYSRKTKLRKDTVAVFEGITFNSDNSYQAASGTFQQGVNYYTKNGDNYEKQIVNVGQTIPSGYYIQIKTYTGINVITTKYDSTGDNLITEINNTTHKIVVKKEENNTTTTLFTISFTINSELGTLSTASVDGNTDYNAIISAAGNGLVILDSTITDNYEEISADEAYTCSATEKKYNANNIYLSQLGLHFAFTSKVAVYVRIHIQDAWKRTRVYATNEKAVYILKDQINGNSPFSVSDSDWYFDPTTNYAYLKTMYVPVADEEGNYPQQEYTFNVNEAYFYADESTSAYTQHIDVQVKFTVDIVQANRVMSLWHLDPSVEFDS